MMKKKHHEDSIGAIGDFRKRHVHYEIPYGCLYNKEFPNMLAAGRIVSASGDGWEVTRVIPSGCTYRASSRHRCPPGLHK